MVSDRPPSASRPAGRDYARLLRAARDLLAALARGGDDEAALVGSFQAAAEGLGAQKALLLTVESTAPLTLQCICTRGPLTAAQIRACEAGESVPGVSSSLLRSVIAAGRGLLIEDPRLDADAAKTPALSDTAFSVIAAPILDGVSGEALAVVYLQCGHLGTAYTAEDLGWLEDYAAAVGHAFGYFLRKERQERELLERLAAGSSPEEAPEILGGSAETLALRRKLHQIFIPSLAAEHPEPVLILGPRGTGKDLVARYLHAYSRRGKRPFVAVNCAEITDELAAARFFGHRRGSFTGALTEEPGLFRAADGGVLFLDEIGDLSPRAQAHLLRVLENHTVTPVGGTREHEVDVAVVLATNLDLDAAVAAGRLRADVYDRFRTLAIRLAPLAERPADVPLLLEHFRRHHERKHRKPTLGFAPEAFRALAAYSWPGNVRELARACALFVIHAEAGAAIDRALIATTMPEVLSAAPNPKAAPLLADALTLREAVAAFERELILARLERHGGSVKAAQESLGLTRTTFHRYRHALGIAGGEE